MTAADRNNIIIMHRRPTALTTTSSKVAASRERRARRGDKLDSGGGIRNINGHLPNQSKIYPEKKLAVVRKCLVLFGLALFSLILINHFTANSDGSKDGNESGSWKLPKALHPKNALKRMRNGKSTYHSAQDSIEADGNAPQTANEFSQSPYTEEALNKNPYLGWQPPLAPSPLDSSFSWRRCFEADAKSDGTGQPGTW